MRTNKSQGFNNISNLKICDEQNEFKIIYESIRYKSKPCKPLDQYSNQLTSILINTLMNSLLLKLNVE